MTRQPWRDALDALTAGPYAGRGGLAALAADLGVPLPTLQSWRWGKRSPTYANRQKVLRLAEAHRLVEPANDDRPA